MPISISLIILLNTIKVSRKSTIKVSTAVTPRKLTAGTWKWWVSKRYFLFLPWSIFRFPAMSFSGCTEAREYLPEGGRWMMATPKDVEGSNLGGEDVSPEKRRGCLQVAKTTTTTLWKKMVFSILGWKEIKDNMVWLVLPSETLRNLVLATEWTSWNKQHSIWKYCQFLRLLWTQKIPRYKLWASTF